MQWLNSSVGIAWSALNRIYRLPMSWNTSGYSVSKVLTRFVRQCTYMLYACGRSRFQPRRIVVPLRDVAVR